MKIWFLLFLGFLFLGAKSEHTNALIDAESPYLLQHAHNPVDWVPYHDSIFQKAEKEHKLIFLSIGYSTCHWCHVMEEESFENEEVAALLNRGFISVKVDKEELPQIDAYYQHLHTLLKKGRNGWPLSIFLTAKGDIVYIARYIPLDDAYGVEGMRHLLPRLSMIYHDNGCKVLVAKNKQRIEEADATLVVESNESVISRYMQKMRKRYDKVYGGFDRGIKFPLASHLNFLLDIYLLKGDNEAFEMVKASLEVMAKGGIYDQIEGGFYRYTTHADWVVPHFEKMLYTQAELIPLYVKMALLTNDPFYKKIVKETIAESFRIFDKEGLFYAATDADSAGREGGYFIYRYDEVKSALQKAGFSFQEIDENMDYFDIDEVGNFEEGYSNVQFHTGINEIPKRFGETKAILKSLRKSKPFPFVDKKIITAWNAMMIKALFIASKIDKQYGDIAVKKLRRLLKKLYHDNRLYHKYFAPHPLTQEALLEDYAFLIDALLEGYAYNYDKRYLQLARKLTKEAIAKFYAKGGWYLDSAHIAKVRYQDRYYTDALARFYHDMISIASLTYDLKFLQEIEDYLNVERGRIYQRIDKSPEAARALVRIASENIVLKSTKENLRNSKEQLDKIRYPFLLRKAEKMQLFLLCNKDTCFFYDKNVTKVIEKLKKK